MVFRPQVLFKLENSCIEGIGCSASAAAQPQPTSLVPAHLKPSYPHWPMVPKKRCHTYVCVLATMRPRCRYGHEAGIREYNLSCAGLYSAACAQRSGRLAVAQDLLRMSTSGPHAERETSAKHFTEACICGDKLQDRIKWSQAKRSSSSVGSRSCRRQIGAFCRRCRSDRSDLLASPQNDDHDYCKTTSIAFYVLSKQLSSTREESS